MASTTLHHHPGDGSQCGPDKLEDLLLLLHLPRQIEESGVEGSHMDVNPGSCCLHGLPVSLIQDKMDLGAGPSLGELEQDLLPHPVAVPDVSSHDLHPGQVQDELEGEVSDVLVLHWLWHAISRDYDGAKQHY